MKKVCLILLAMMVLLVSGCGQEAPAETTAPATAVPETTVPATTEATVPATTEETVPVPDVVEAAAEVDGVPIVLAILSRGDTVDVVDSFDEKHYVVKRENGYGLVEKSLVRPSGEPEYETWTGYARYQAKFYDNARLMGEPLKTLSTNTPLEVLDDIGWGYVVRCEDVIGYVSKDYVSQYRYSGGGGGGGGGGADGGDISLMHGHMSFLSTLAPQEGAVSGQATILADGTQIVLGYFDRGEMIPVVTEAGFAEEKEGYHVVYLDGLYAWVLENLAHMEGEETYTEWTGYSKYNAEVFADMWLLGDTSERLGTNTEVTVLFELEGSYYVNANGITGFMAKDMVSTFRNATGGGGGGGGGEWTPPAM